MKKSWVAFVFVLFFGKQESFGSDIPSVIHHSVRMKTVLKENQLQAEDRLTIKNSANRELITIPILLYRLLIVENVTDSNGMPIDFTQEIRVFEDEKSWQVNAVTIKLPSPLLPFAMTTFTIQYTGYIFGYQEVMQYVRDRIDETYTLIRPDALAYPMVAFPRYSSLMKAYESQFSFDIHVTVPSAYTVAAGGVFDGMLSTGDSTTFSYRSHSPTWRMDIAVAKFKPLRD